MKPIQRIAKRITRALAWTLLSGSALAAQPFDLDPAAAYTSHPAIAALPDRGFLAVWTRDRRVPLSFGPDIFVPESIVWQRLRPNGEAAAPVATVLSQGCAAILQTPGVAASGPGAEIVWGRSVVEGFLLEGKRWQAAGLSQRRSLAGCPDGGLRGLRIVPVPVGYWLIWNEVCEGLRIVGQRLDPAGRPTDLARILVPAAALPSAEFDFAATPDGGLVGAWAQRIVGPQGADRALVIRRFRPNGEPRGAAFRASPESVHSRPSSPPFEPAILAPTARRIQLAWRRIADGRVITRTFDSDGRPQGPEHTVGELGDALEGHPLWAGRANDTAVLVWRRTNAPSAGCLARRVAESGPIGDEALVAATCPGASAALSEGRLLLIWQEPLPLPGDNGIPTRVRGRSLPLAALR